MARTSVLFGLSEDGWVAVADPTVALGEQRELVREWKSTGSIDGTAYSELSLFENPHRYTKSAGAVQLEQTSLGDAIADYGVEELRNVAVSRGVAIPNEVEDASEEAGAALLRAAILGEEPPELDEGEGEPDLMQLKKDDLLALAAERGVDVDPSAKKADIAAALEAAAGSEDDKDSQD